MWPWGYVTGSQLRRPGGRLRDISGCCVVWWCPDDVWDCSCLVALSQPSQHGLRITRPCPPGRRTGSMDCVTRQERGGGGLQETFRWTSLHTGPVCYCVLWHLQILSRWLLDSPHIKPYHSGIDLWVRHLTSARHITLYMDSEIFQIFMISRGILLLINL